MQSRDHNKAAMQLHGSTEGNLISAIRSATRLRGQPVHSDTLEYWSGLIRHARAELLSQAAMPPESLRNLITKLEAELGQRPS
jgi:hypothetical protein